MPSKYNRFKDVDSAYYLQRCIEFENLGKQAAAHSILKEFFISNRIYRIVFDESYEQLFQKFLLLCLKLRKNTKTGLLRYRIICSRSSTPRMYISRCYKTFLEYIENEIELETDKLRRKHGEGFIAAQFDSAALQFLFECFLGGLDTTRYMSDQIELYINIAFSAISFCGSLKRSNELKKLHKILNFHIIHFAKYQGKKDVPDMTSPEVLEPLVCLRFALLGNYFDCAVFSKTPEIMEEVYTLLSYSKTGTESFSSTMFLSYYKLVQNVSWEYKCSRLHSVALYHFIEAAQKDPEFEEEVIENYKKQLLLSTILIETEKPLKSKKALKKEKFEKRAIDLLNFRQKGEGNDFSQSGVIKSVVLEKHSQFLVSEDESGAKKDSPYGSLLKLCCVEDKAVKMTPFEMAEISFKSIKSIAEEYVDDEEITKYTKILQRRFLSLLFQRCAEVYLVMPVALLESWAGMELKNMDSVLFAANHGNFAFDFANQTIIFETTKSPAEEITKISKLIFETSEKIYLLSNGPEALAKKQLEKRKIYFKSQQNMINQTSNQIDQNPPETAESVAEKPKPAQKSQKSKNAAAKAKAKKARADALAGVNKTLSAIEKGVSSEKSLAFDGKSYQTLKKLVSAASGEKLFKMTAAALKELTEAAEGEARAFLAAASLRENDKDYAEREVMRGEEALWAADDAEYRSKAKAVLTAEVARLRELKEAFEPSLPLIQAQLEPMRAEHRRRFEDQNERFEAHRARQKKNNGLLLERVQRKMDQKKATETVNRKKGQFGQLDKENQKQSLKETIINLEKNLKAQKTDADPPKSDPAPKPAETAQKAPQKPKKTLKSLKAILNAAEKDKTALFAAKPSPPPPNKTEAAKEPSAATPVAATAPQSALSAESAPKEAGGRASAWKPKKLSQIKTECSSQEKVLKCKFGTIKFSKETFD